MDAAEKEKLADRFFSSGRYPADAYIEIGHADLVYLDSTMGGLLAGYFSDESTLTPERRQMLLECTDALEQVESQIPESARAYFREYAEIARAVLR